MKTILVIEDDPNIQEVLTLALEFDGYKVIPAMNGREALDALKKMERPGLILLDLMMPVMNGWEFAEIINRDEKFNKIPVLIVSAFSDRAEQIKCSGFIQKPLELENLLSSVHQHFH